MHPAVAALVGPAAPALGVSVSVVMGRSRRARICAARTEIWYQLYHHHCWSLLNIARQFNRSHCAIRYALETLNKRKAMNTLVTIPQEQFLAKNKAAILTSANSNSLKKDLGLVPHIDAVYYAEDLAEEMGRIAQTFRDRKKPGDDRRAETYDVLRMKANQIELLHLDYLSTVLTKAPHLN